ncbi:hypothetical protein AAF712_013726 [Marasmius tenuissimus]|uniref:Cytochrome P450 n=1 Tax=Marasmius tenuissimus TaxID=585030 RepID=A0ABR2ZE62_9AGAR
MPEMELYGGFLTKIRADHESGVNRADCFVGRHLKARESSVATGVTSGRGLTACGGWLRDTLLAYSAGSVLEAGSDTTSSSIISCVMFMLRYPLVLEKVRQSISASYEYKGLTCTFRNKAREEIDRVVGKDRLPTFEDEKNLHYIVAIVKEVLRCRPPLPLGKTPHYLLLSYQLKTPSSYLGVPHRSTEDTIYNGYLIPKGSLVFGNVWALHLDPSRFESPMEFNPDRWMLDCTLQSDGSKSGKKRDHFSFGWGRRFCIGSHIAEGSLFIAIARIIWGFNLYGPKDSSTGATQVPDPWDEDNFSSGVAMSALPFNVAFEVRSFKHEEVIENAFRDAQEHWDISGLARDKR